MIDLISRYLNLFKEFARNNFIRDLEFRSNFLIQAFVAVDWVVMQLIVIEVYFQFTNSIAGWNKTEIFIFIGIWRIIKSIFDSFFRANLFYLPETIDRGDMDYTLTKPINGLFLTSTRFHHHSELSNLAIGVVIIIYGLTKIGFDVNPLILTVLLASVILGSIIYYSFFAIFAFLSFFTTRLTAIADFNEVLSQTLRYPLDIFSKDNQIVATILFPLLFVATVPAKIFLGKSALVLILLEFVVGLACLLIVYRFWLFALKRYSSASS